MGQKIQDLTEETIIGLDDYLPFAKSIGGGNYASRKVKRKNVLRLAEIAEVASLLPDDKFLVERGDPPVLHRVKHSNVIRQLFVQTVDKSVGGTVESSLIGTGVGSLVIPAGLLSVIGRALVIEIQGNANTAPSGVGTLRLRLKVGAYTNMDRTFTPGANYDSALYFLRLVALRKNSGINPALQVRGHITFDEISVADGNSKTFFFNYFNITDPTVDQTLDLTAQFGAGVNNLTNEAATLSFTSP